MWADSIREFLSKPFAEHNKQLCHFITDKQQTATKYTLQTDTLLIMKK